jgi:Flp pilus assembly protein CpaB
VSRRARALGFLAAAVVCGLLAAMVAAGYRSSVEAGYGELRPVVVAATELREGVPLGPAEVRSALTVRRVPARFAPATALRRPSDALGQAPSAPIPAGAYVLAEQLEVPRPEPAAAPGLGAGKRPVEVSVSGAGALLLGGGSPEGARVDVVVSRPSGLGERARTYIAARGVRLLALEGPGGPGEGWTATLALTSPEALELISADSSGRQIRLLPDPAASGL